MNPIRLILAVVAGFAWILGSDFLIHGYWLNADYMQTPSLWRPEPDMQAAFFPWMISAQLLCALGFVLVWATGFAGRDAATGALVGLYMGLFQGAWALINYAVLPISQGLALKWFFAGIVQSIILGVIVAAIYKPATMVESRA